MPSDRETPNDLIRQRFSVTFEYPVAFTRGVFRADNDLLADLLSERAPGARVLALLDAGLVAEWPTLPTDVRQYFAGSGGNTLVAPPRVHPGGEQVKASDALVNSVLDAIATQQLDRQSVVMGVGGGAFLDAVGYAAAIAHRGIRHVRVPTTVLAQNDSGVGVKNGINAFGAKNFLGTFAPPLAVINDAEFLRTLSPRDRAAGMAESVKVAVLRDAKFFGWLESAAPALRRFSLPEVEQAVRRTAELHLAQIAGGGDPFETGSARPLDFGHWSAHKLESMSGFTLRHGEAVAIGMALDCTYASLIGMLSSAEASRVCSLIAALGLPTYHELLESVSTDGAPEFLHGLEDFRQHLGGALCVPLVDSIGSERQVFELDRSLVVEASQLLRKRRAA